MSVCPLYDLSLFLFFIFVAVVLRRGKTPEES